MEEADKGWLMTTTDLTGWMFLLFLAHLGCPGQNPESRKTVVCVVRDIDNCTSSFGFSC